MAKSTEKSRSSTPPQKTSSSASWMRARWAVAGSLLGLVVAATAGRGNPSGNPDAGPIGAVLDQIAYCVDCSTGALGSAVDQARSSIGTVGLEQQVRIRVLLDREIESDRIQVELQDENTIVLKGIVENDAAKEKAVTLARDTRGVGQVLDHLAVEPPGRIVSAEETAETSTAEAASNGSPESEERVGRLQFPRFRR